MGIAYVFGTAKSMQYDVIAHNLAGQVPSAGLSFGLLLILAGIGFKIAAVPFHVWAPDVYEGAPTPVTAFLAIGSKAGGFILLLNLLITPFGDPAVVQVWTPVLYLLAGLSLVMGNLGAIPQRSLKRMLAYSGIGHAGYLLIGVATHSELGHVAVVIYLVTYLLGAGTAFLVLVLARKKIQNDMIYSFAGLSQRSPLLAFALAIALVSMAGIPPTAGFVGKFLIFSAAWEAHQYGLVALGAFTAVAGLYYYLGVVRYMFWSEPVDTDAIPVSGASQFLLGVLILLLIGLGLWMQPLIVAVQQALF
jgi:NADH-quinone oxidoreductase subunit N